MVTERFMRDSDAFSWYMERDPTLRSTIVTVAWLDRSPRWDVLVDRLERASRIIPLFRMRLVELPARLPTPRWVVDDGFELGWHLRRVEAPAPGTAATVVEIARVAATTGFDLAHPLWEFTLVEGLEGDRAALVMKLHHSLTDGLGGMQLAMLLFDTDAAASRRVPREPLPPPPAADDRHRTGLVRDALGHDWARFARALGTELRRVPSGTLRTARHPMRAAADLAETARSIGRTVAPVPETRSPIMTGRSLRRRLDVVTVGLSHLKAGAAAAGGSLNDGFLAAITGGLRRYHDAYAAVPGELRVMVPISIRQPGDPLASNRITLQRFVVPLVPEDPATRIRVIGERTRAVRHERSLPHTNTIAGVLNLLPPGVIGRMLKQVDFVASNVPGITDPLFLAGARVTAHVAFGPTIGTALNATLLSYHGTCYVGLTIDTAAVADPDGLVPCIAEGFDEVIALAGRHPRARVPVRAGAFPGSRRRSGTSSGRAGGHPGDGR